MALSEYFSRRAPVIRLFFEPCSDPDGDLCEVHCHGKLLRFDARFDGRVCSLSPQFSDGRCLNHSTAPEAIARRSRRKTTGRKDQRRISWTMRMYELRHLPDLSPLGALLVRAWLDSGGLDALIDTRP